MPGLFRSLIVVSALAVSALGATATAVPAGAAVGGSPPTAESVCGGVAAGPFGDDVCVFNDSMPQAQIQADLDAIATAQVPASSQFGE